MPRRRRFSIINAIFRIPRRRKLFRRKKITHKKKSLSSRDIKNLQNIDPYASIIIFALMLGGIVFIVGFCSIISNDFSFSAILALLVLTIVLIIGTSIALIRNYNKKIEIKYRGLNIANIDTMTGVEFEGYLKRVLANQGYTVSTTKVSGDLGVDLVASGFGNKFSIQAKRYSNKVSRRAISDAVAGMYHYDCNRAMVITNNYFSPGAIELANSTGCILINRDTLAQWVNDYQNINTQIDQKPNLIKTKIADTAIINKGKEITNKLITQILERWKTRSGKFTIIGLSLLFIVLCCIFSIVNLSSGGDQQPQPTLDMADMFELVMATANAANTLTAEAYPTATSTETLTLTPTITPFPTNTITPIPTATLIYKAPTVVIAPQQPPAQSCCKTCTNGKACGDSCISKDKTCHQPPGCACDG